MYATVKGDLKQYAPAMLAVRIYVLQLMPKTLYAHACAHARYTNEMGRRLSLILVYCCDPDSHSHCPSPLLHVLANPDSIGLYS